MTDALVTDGRSLFVIEVRYHHGLSLSPDNPPESAAHREKEEIMLLAVPLDRYRNELLSMA